MKIDFGNIYLFTWEDLYPTEVWNELGIEAFRKLCANQEGSLKTTEREFRELVSEELAGLAKEDQRSYYMQNLQRDDIMIKELLRLQRYSLCQSIFSFFEGRMKTVCEQIEERFNLKIPKKNKNGQGDLDRLWKFLLDFFELDNHPLEAAFIEINRQKLTRNIIAHQDGVVRAAQENDIVLMPGLELHRYGAFCQLVITDTAYVTGLLDKIYIFLKLLLLDIDARYIALTQAPKA